MSRFTNDGMWAEWQETVKAALPNFAKNPIYVEQDSVPEERFRSLANTIKTPPFDSSGMTRDVEFGARVAETCLGPVTRMWLESEVEIDFLARHSIVGFRNVKVLDIGAGYGRLVTPLARNGVDVTAVDAVPISTQICRHYCARFAPSVKVLSLEEFEATYQNLKFDLAINCHSWNECKLSQIKEWLAVLKEMAVPYLFTVSHGQMNHHPEPSYRAYGDDHPDFRCLLEAQYELIAEESLGLSPSPHAIWRLRK